MLVRTLASTRSKHPYLHCHWFEQHQMRQKRCVRAYNAESDMLRNHDAQAYGHGRTPARVFATGAKAHGNDEIMAGVKVVVKVKNQIYR